MSVRFILPTYLDLTLLTCVKMPGEVALSLWIWVTDVRARPRMAAIREHAGLPPPWKEVQANQREQAK